MAEIPQNTPKRFWIEKANEYMIKHCDFLVCYVGATWGGAYKTMTRAKRKKEMKIINLHKGFKGLPLEGKLSPAGD